MGYKKAKKLIIKATRAKSKKSTGSGKKRGRRALYTDEERQAMSSLRARRRYYQKKLNQIAAQAASQNTITFKDIRNNISEDNARLLFYQGYFDGDKQEEYYNRDFREWMTSNGDDQFMGEIIEEYNRLASEDTRILDTIDEVSSEKMKEYSDKVKDIEEQIQQIKTKAKDRRDIEIVKDLAKRNQKENAKSLLEALDKGDILLSKLSNPERAAVEAIKSKFAQAVLKGVDLKGLDDSAQIIAKHSIYAGIMSNPMEGIRTAIKETVVNEVVQNYGNAAGPVAESLIDIATGKGGVKNVVFSVFQGVVSKSGLNEDLMKERAIELIDSGESTEQAENMKQLGRDIVIDIAKDVILSGGQIYAAIPKIIKDVMFNVGKAGIRSMK